MEEEGSSKSREQTITVTSVEQISILPRQERCQVMLVKKFRRMQLTAKETEAEREMKQRKVAELTQRMELSQKQAELERELTQRRVAELTQRMELTEKETEVERALQKSEREQQLQLKQKELELAHADTQLLRTKVGHMQEQHQLQLLQGVAISFLTGVVASWLGFKLLKN